MAENQGKTLWEMLMDRLHGSGNGNGAGIPFYNPLDWRVGAPVNIPYSNGPAFAGYDFSITEIREYTRHINKQEFRFTDYSVRGTNTKSFVTEEDMQVRIRAVPNSAGSTDSLLLRLFDEFAFAETFLEVVNDDTGIFEMSENEHSEKIVYNRINDVRGSYNAVVLNVPATTPDGKAIFGQTKASKLEYWDYWRDMPLATGKTAKEFVFVEMDSDSGWFQIWRGSEFFQ
jgi:hypothetical protein